MLEDLVAFLDRQYDFLRAHSGAQYVRQLRKYSRTVLTDVRTEGFVEDLRREAADLVSAYQSHDADSVQKLVALKNELIHIAPDLDDSKAAEPGPGQIDLDWRDTLAYFDQVAGREGLHSGITFHYPIDDPSRTAVLHPLLASKLHNAQWIRRLEDGSYTKADTNQRPELDDLAIRILNVERAHSPVCREFINELTTSGGIALAFVERLVVDLNVRFEPRRSKTDAWRDVDLATQLVLSGLHDLHKELYDSSVKVEKVSAEWEARVRPYVARFHEELRTRIGARRSLLGLLHRFKCRCEWHDAERLRKLMSRKGAHEDDLSAELARWLFDQGFSPITRPLTGGLEPDLLDPSFKPTVYVEAKRYRRSSGSREHLRKGVFQVHDTVARLKGTAYEVREALFVIFREGGPRYVLPERVQGEGWVVLPVLIDIAPSKLSGSRQSERPIVIPDSEWQPNVA